MPLMALKTFRAETFWNNGSFLTSNIEVFSLQITFNEIKFIQK